MINIIEHCPSEVKDDGDNYSSTSRRFLTKKRGQKEPTKKNEREKREGEMLLSF